MVLVSHGLRSTNWNSAELGSKRQMRISETASVISVVHIAIQQGELAARNAVNLVRGGQKVPEKIDYRLKTLVTFTDPEIAVVGLTNSALPFVCFAYAALSINAGVSAIFNSATPLFAAVIAWAWLAFNSGNPQEISEARNHAKDLAPKITPGEGLMVAWIVKVEEGDFLGGITAMNDMLAMYPHDKHLYYLAGNWLMGGTATTRPAT